MLWWKIKNAIMPAFEQTGENRCVQKVFWIFHFQYFIHNSCEATLNSVELVDFSKVGVPFCAARLFCC